ncbi:MAG: HDOD domain-containing protein, partial [Thermoguttaceae bacterium]
TTLPNPKCGPFDLKIFRKDSLRKGVFAKVLSTGCPGVDPEELFVGAMLQDVAIPIVAAIYPEEYEQILVRHLENGEQISALEQEAFGWNHADIGAYLAKEWGFGDDLALCIATHTNDDNSDMSTKSLADQILYMSTLLPSASHQQWREADKFFSCLQKIDLPGKNDPRKILATTDEIFSELNSTLSPHGMENGVVSLIDYHRQYLRDMHS